MTSNFFYLIPFMILFVLNSTPKSSGSPSRETRDLINKICRQTIDTTYCNDVFVKNLYTPNEDAKGLCQIAITQTLIHASNTQIFLRKSEAAERDVNVKNLYKICEAGYQNLVNEFTDANFAFVQGDYRSMVFDIEKCGRFLSDCEDVLASQVPQLNLQNKQNRVLVTMAFLSGNLIEGANH